MGAAQTVCREVGIVTELLEAKHIDMTLLHVTGYFLAGVSGDFVAEMMYVVGGYGEAAAGLAFPVRRRSSGRYIIIGGTEPDDSPQIFPVEEDGCLWFVWQDTSNSGTASPSIGITTELSG